MTRTSQVEHKIRRAVEDLDNHCRQLERLARRVSRILVKDEPDGDDFDSVAPLGAALDRLDGVVKRVRDAAPNLTGDGSWHGYSAASPATTPPVTTPPVTTTAETTPVETTTAETTTADKSWQDRFAHALTELGVNPDADIEPHSERQPGECVLRGSSPSVTVPTILEFLASQRKTGTLRVDSESERFAIELADGLIVHAVSDCTPLQERLGSVLLQRGTIGAEQLQDALDDDWEGLLGDILLRRGVVDRDELVEALQEQASLLFRRLFANHETTFRFLENESSGNDLQIDANVTMLLLEGARSNDESQIEPDTEWSVWLK